MSTAPRGPGPDRDSYTALRDQMVTHVYGEQLGVAGAMSITPPQLEYPVRGRDALLAALLEAPPGSAHVLCAAGGHGRTTVALAVAEQARRQGNDVWRVSAADAESLSAGMRALAVRLGAMPERLRLAWSGREGDAPDLVWDLLTDRIRVLGAEYPDTLWTRYGLAGVQAQRGDLAGAEAGYQAVLTDRTRVLGADHPDTLATKNALLALRDRRR